MLTIDADDVVLQLASIHGFSDVAYKYVGSDGCIFACLDGHGIDLIDDGNLAVCIYVVVLGPDSDITGWKNQVGLVHGMNHVHHGELVGLQFYRIDVDLNLPILAAVGLRNRGARNIRNLVSDCRTAQGPLAASDLVPLPSSVTRQTGRFDASKLQHDRWKRAGRKPSQICHREVGNIADCGICVCSRLKVDLNHAHPGRDRDSMWLIPLPSVKNRS